MKPSNGLLSSWGHKGALTPETLGRTDGARMPSMQASVFFERSVILSVCEQPRPSCALVLLCRAASLRTNLDPFKKLLPDEALAHSQAGTLHLPQQAVY